MGTKHRVGFAVYKVMGSVNVQLAEKTGFSQEDAEVLKEALRTLFENDASSARPEGSMEVCKMYWWQHDEKTPSVSSGKLQRGFQIKANTVHPRKFEDYDIDKNLVDIRIESKEGFDCINEGNNFIILNTTLTEDLIKEGLARELVSKVQNMRKEKDFNIEDRINLFYNGNSYFESVLKEFESYIKEETLALSLIKKEELTNLVKLNDLDVYLDIEKR